MCYSPDGGTFHQEGTVTNCNDREYFDCGYDDYFDSNPEAGEYLATHWNMGSPLNKMIRFGGVGNATPTADFTQSCVETTCQFQNTSTDDAGVAENQWAFGYGAGSSLANPNHTFPGPGTYQVTLNVRDALQSWDDVTKPVTVTEGRQLLTSATPFNDTAGMRDTFKRYTIKVPAGADELEVTIDGPTCHFLTGPKCEPNLDLYLKKGTDPTRQDFDVRSKSATSSDETVTVDAPTKGNYRIGVENRFGTAGAQFQITATVTN